MNILTEVGLIHMLQDVENVVDFKGANVLSLNELKKTLPGSSVFLDESLSLETSSAVDPSREMADG